jgi:hypothetical protein
VYGAVVVVLAVLAVAGLLRVRRTVGTPAAERPEVLSPAQLPG